MQIVHLKLVIEGEDGFWGQASAERCIPDEVVIEVEQVVVEDVHDVVWVETGKDKGFGVDNVDLAGALKKEGGKVCNDRYL